MSKLMVIYATYHLYSKLVWYKFNLILAFMICNTLWFSFFYVMNEGQSTVCSLASRMRQPRSIRIMGAPLLLAALRQLP